jgi:DNA-binding NarL/FixJ family response regulator
MKQIRIVIADDHALVREGLSRLLSSYPKIEVVGLAEDGISAIERARDTTPDVLLLDIAMPNLGGLAAIPRIMEASRTTRILVLSMYDEPEYAQAVVERGACGLVSKAASADSLYRAIQAAARGETLPVRRALSQREREVLALIGVGKTNAQIASSLLIQEKTVEHHRQRLMDRLEIHTQAGLVAHARRIGLA